MTKKIKAYKAGLWAESLAAVFLMLKGYRILRRRYKCPVGEIDLIAYKRGTLVAVEVKYRKAPVSEGAIWETIHTKNRYRVEQAVLHFLACNPRYSSACVRFDAIAVSGPLRICHLDNAWAARA